MDYQFTKENTNIAKGVAVIMLLIHHLFYSTSNPYNEIQLFGMNFWNTLAFFCKVTVAMFLILSGFGLYKSFSKEENIKHFYIKHLTKIYLNYWLIWLLFVPVGIFLYGRTLNIVYENHIISKLIINIAGLQQYFNFWGYNPTWWFISLIISLYVLFPILYKLSKKKYVLEAIFILSFLGFTCSYKWVFLFCFIPAFILGMLTAKYSLFEQMCKIISKNKKSLILSVLIFIILLLCRVISGKWFIAQSAGESTIFDTFIAFLIITYSKLIFNNAKSYIYIYI